MGPQRRMAVFDAKFRQHCEALSRVAQRQWGRRLLGRRRELTLTGGTEATEVVDYNTGDDFRYVDWNRCARLDELVSKQFHGDENSRVNILLDCSGSMDVGQPTKFEAARRIAAALAYLALDNLDSVGITLFSDRIIGELRPVRGRKRIPQALRFLEDQESCEGKTDLRGSVEQFVRMQKGKCLAVLVSDFMDMDGFRPAMNRLRIGRHEPYLVQVLDRKEADPSCLGGTKFIDAETGEVRRDLIEPADLEAYREVFEEYIDSVRSYCAGRGIRRVQTFSDVDYRECAQRMIRVARASRAGGAGQ
ncbi:MAG: DUF58 domain-containing protein [Planctomycetales bacterium]